jgi:hypothetical protein
MYMVLTSQEEMLFPEFEPVTSMSQESILTIGLRLMLVYKSMNLKKSHLQMTQRKISHSHTSVSHLIPHTHASVHEIFISSLL